MAAQLLPLKAGSTLSYAGFAALPAGTWTATCQVRTALSFKLLGTVVVTLGAAVAGQTPMSLYLSAADTATWAPGLHELDIRYVDPGGQVMHTTTLILPVLKAVTQP